MPAGNSLRNPPSTDIHHHTLPPSSKATLIRNKDGTKLITVPSRKVSNPDATLASSNTAPLTTSTQLPLHSASMGDSYPAVPNNGGKKKKKKKGKQNNQQQQQNVVHEHSNLSLPADFHDYGPNHLHKELTSPKNKAHEYQRDIKASLDEFNDGCTELIDPELDEEEEYSDQDQAFDEDEDDDSYISPQRTQIQPTTQPTGKKKNKKKKKKGGNRDNFPNSGANVTVGQNGTGVNTRKGGKDRIWNTSTNEERERIKEFWLSLGESERRSLVKVEKEAVLKKMKEQQKHSCSCSVCGRKRTAIEEELEVLYDAYYEELEQYANQQQASKYSDDDFDDEDDDDYDDDEEVLDEPLPENDPRPDFFNFGNSLTVQGGILTVADDLLKNDGKKFIEMMEQLAERRMQREEEANAAASGHQPLPMSMQQSHAIHTHTSQQEYGEDEEYEEDEEEEEEYDEEEEDEADTMTEEQRMEEGRRMFQIFAARMFEQRVLTAYRERVAQERQRKLLEELDEEDRLREEREQKKAKEKDKKKEKKRLQKLAKEEERLRKEAERAAEEAQRKVLEEKKNEELRKRREEQRLKREAEKKAAEEERHRKEEEKRRRQQEEREREAERERKRKENLERERKKKEEAARKAREEREARDREAREKREREERERREREAKAKKEAAEKERIRKEEEAKAKAEAAAAAAAAKRPPPVSLPISIPNQPPQHPPSAYGSPHLSVATPAIPKQPIGSSPARPRNPSQQGSIQGSVSSSPKTPHVLPRIGASASPSTPILQQNASGLIFPPNKTFQFPPQIPPSPIPNFIAPPPGVTPPDTAFGGIPPMGMNGLSPVQPPFIPGFPQRPLGNGPPMYPQGQLPLGAHPHFRPFGMPNGMMQVPGAVGARSIPPQGRGLFMDSMAPGLPQPQLSPGMPILSNGSPFMNRTEPIPISTHNRVPSGSFEPIQRPAPIQRPSSVAPPKSADDHQSSIDEISKVMGSRALLEDDEDSATVENLSPSRRSSAAMFNTRVAGFPGTPGLFPDHLGSAVKDSFASWGNPIPLGTVSNSLPNTWGNGAGWSDTDPARGSSNRRRVGRLDQIRNLACQVCRELAGPNNDFVEIGTLEKAIEQAAPPDLAIQSTDLITVLDVEGDPQNGGGNFKFSQDANGRTSVQYEPDEPGSEGNIHHAPGAPIGEIGSPSVNSAIPFRIPIGPTGMPTSPSAFC